MKFCIELSSLGIKPNADFLVKLAFCFNCLLLGLALTSELAWSEDGIFPSINSEDNAPPTIPTEILKPSEISPPPEGPDSIPEIEAKTYPVRVVRRSTSKRVYLLENLEEQNPPVGRILLLKKDGKAQMAFRVLKLYPEKKQFAARKVRRYRRRKTLPIDMEFDVIEKISDIIPELPNPADEKDLTQLEEVSLENELKPNAVDAELDSTPPVSESESTEEEQKASEEDELSDLTVVETQPIEQTNHWLSGGFGFIKNNGPPSLGGTYYFAAGEIRYGLSLGHMLFLKSPQLQDSIALETGLYGYKAINFAAAGDSYTVLSLPLSLRYNFIFSEKFGLFLYAGILYNRAFAGGPVSNGDIINLLTNIQPLGGAGMLFQIGPSWYIRGDLGIEAITLGLLIKF